jgi:hypothetical protein
MLRGFDVSNWQGTEDWPGMVKTYGLSFAFAKALEYSEDRMFDANWAGMKDAGIVRGAYDYCHPDGYASANADTFLDIVGPTLPTDLLCLDLETSTLSSAATAQYAEDWAIRISYRTGGRYRPGVYCGSGFMRNRAYSGLHGPFGWWWFPAYPNKYVAQNAWPSTINPTMPSPNVWGSPPDFWQFSESFPVPQDPHDASVFGGSLADLKSLNGVAPVIVVDSAIGKAERGMDLYQREGANDVWDINAMGRRYIRDVGIVDDWCRARGIARSSVPKMRASSLDAIPVIPSDWASKLGE